MKSRYYLCGPMRGIKAFNFGEFHRVSDMLRQLGHEVFSPAERDLAIGFDPTNMDGFEDLAEHGFSLRDALGADTAWICREADAVVVLDGWEMSSGARAEVALARALGLPVYDWRTVLVEVPVDITAPTKRLASQLGERPPVFGTVRGWVLSRRGTDVTTNAIVAATGYCGSTVRQVLRTLEREGHVERHGRSWRVLAAAVVVGA